MKNLRLWCLKDSVTVKAAQVRLHLHVAPLPDHHRDRSCSPSLTAQTRIIPLDLNTCQFLLQRNVNAIGFQNYLGEG